jgi:hypothetical protein
MSLPPTLLNILLNGCRLKGLSSKEPHFNIDYRGKNARKNEAETA